MLQRVAAVLQRVAVRDRALTLEGIEAALMSVAVRCIVLQCSVWQCVAVCCALTDQVPWQIHFRFIIRKNV